VGQEPESKNRLAAAVRQGDIGVVEELLVDGADPNARDFPDDRQGG